MKIIENKKEFEEYYFYDSKPTKYPIQYPCVVFKEMREGGLVGDFWDHIIFYPPTGVNIGDFYSSIEVVGDYLNFD